LEKRLPPTSNEDGKIVKLKKEGMLDLIYSNFVILKNQSGRLLIYIQQARILLAKPGFFERNFMSVFNQILKSKEGEVYLRSINQEIL